MFLLLVLHTFSKSNRHFILKIISDVRADSLANIAIIKYIISFFI